MTQPQGVFTEIRLTSVIQEDIQNIVQELEPTLRPLAGTTLLVTGGSGFLCSYFLDTIAYLNKHVWNHPCRFLCVDNLKSGHTNRIAHLFSKREFRFIQHDISRPLDLNETVDWVVHGASIASPSLYRKYPLEVIAANVDGTRNVLEFARAQKVRSVLYLSTSEVYGDPLGGSIPTPEAYRGNVSCTGPRACYDESKRLAETLCTVYHRLFGLPVKVARPFNVYGPGQRLDDRRIIPDLMSAGLKRQKFVLYSDGRATRTFCYVSDAIRAMWQLLVSEENGEVFNVGNDEEETAIRHLVERMKEVVGPPWLEIETHESHDADYLTDNPQRRCPDVTKLRAHFPWKPNVSLAEGLRRTFQSYQELEAKK